MKGIIQNFRRGLGVTAQNHVVVSVPSVSTKTQALKLLGKKTVFKSVGGKTIAGKITGTHGTNGLLMVRFIRGLPGQALGMPVVIQ
ncbi:MAG: 50S ribosomal protein L35ae [Candidatus Diapherotrites archaeon]|nr:50S ribosomal protein L35ae [Candidatus Diapherotrites archaeon]